MLSVWRFGPAISGVLMVLVWSAFALVLVEGRDLQAAGHLGYYGETVRVVVIPEHESGAPASLSRAVVGFAENNGLSVAFSRSSGNGLVTLLDTHDRFRNSDGPLAALLGPTSGGKTAALATVLQIPEGATNFPGVLEGVSLSGTFVSDVMFEDRYPVMLLSVEAMPFAEGGYMFAGPHLTDVGGESGMVSGLVQMFEENGMTVVAVVPSGALSVANLLGAALSGLYGVVVLLFTGIVGATQLLVVGIYGALSRERLTVVAVLGASKPNLVAVGFRKWFGMVASGACLGGVIAVLLAFGLDHLALSGSTTKVLVVLGALVLSIAVSLIACWIVARREAGRVALAVPC